MPPFCALSSKYNYALKIWKKETSAIIRLIIDFHASIVTLHHPYKIVSSSVNHLEIKDAAF